MPDLLVGVAAPAVFAAPERLAAAAEILACAPLTLDAEPEGLASDPA